MEEEGEAEMMALQFLLISQLQKLQKIGRKEGEATANGRGRREEEQSPEVVAEVRSLKAQLLKELMVETSSADLEEGETSGKETSSANLEEEVRDIKYKPSDADFLTYNPDLLLKIAEATKLVKVEGAGADVIDWANATVVEEKNDDWGDFEEDWDGDLSPCPKKKFRFRRFDSE